MQKYKDWYDENIEKNVTRFYIKTSFNLFCKRANYTETPEVFLYITNTPHFDTVKFLLDKEIEKINLEFYCLFST